MAFKVIIGRSRQEQLRLKEKGLINLGKQYVQMGQVSSLANRVYLDIATTHVVLVTGKRGSGKSFTISVMAEEISRLEEQIKQRIAVVMFDTLGVFWTMKYPNYRQQDLLDKWKMKPEATKVDIFVPTGHYQNFIDRGMLVDKKFSIRVSDLKGPDWCSIFNLDLLSSQGILIQNTIRKVSSKLRLYSLKDIIDEINESKAEEKVKQSVLNLFLAASTWGLFRKKGTKLKSLIAPGRISILDLSPYTYIAGGFSIKALVIALISRKLLTKRIEVRRFEELRDIKAAYLTEKKEEIPLVWLFIDELQDFLPKDKVTIATDPLIQILREGRQPGISLVGATQQPGELQKDMLTQSDVVIAHRLTAEPDIKALGTIMQTYLLTNIETSMRNLPKYKGAALILDDNSERIYTVKVKPKRSWHGGEAPSAVKITHEIKI